jgi:hypothetical protein
LRWIPKMTALDLTRVEEILLDNIVLAFSAVIAALVFGLILRAAFKGTRAEVS